jgi:hypothetical protein
VAWRLVWTEDDAGVPDGLATLDGLAHVVQDPANAQVAPAPDKIPKATGTGKLLVAWLPADEAGGVAALDGAKFVLGSGLVVSGDQVVGARQAAVPDPIGGLTVDVECRSSLQLVLAALRAHGLIAP